MTVNNLLDLYTDYPLVSPSYCTATGLSSVTGNKVSHDQVTCLLSSKVDSSTLWKSVKPMVCDIRFGEDSLLIIDDSIKPKRYTKANLFITWHYDHCSGKSVKGVNFVSSFYYSPEYDMGFPVGVEYVIKDMEVTNKQGKVVRKSRETKNEMMRHMVGHANFNIDFKYVLADSWFSSSQNMSHVMGHCGSDFIMVVKSNRVVALGKEDKSNGNFISIESLKPEGRTMSVYLKQYDKPVLTGKQVFKNGNGSTDTFYVASSNLDFASLTTIYEKPWKVEEFFAPSRTMQPLPKHP